MCASVTGSTEENKVPQERCFVNSWPKVFSLLCQAERNPIFIKLIKADTILLSLLSVHFSEVCKCTAILDPIFTHCLFIYDAVLFTHLSFALCRNPCREAWVSKGMSSLRWVFVSGTWKELICEEVSAVCHPIISILVFIIFSYKKIHTLIFKVNRSAERSNFSKSSQHFTLQAQFRTACLLLTSKMTDLGR